MDQVEEVKSKVDIVEVISSYIPLKKTGRNYSALCPFHGEKTPSFMVSAERQAFKCFGCGEGGDVFTFVEKMENWDFRETLVELAKKAGVELKSFAPTQSSKQREKIIEINKLTAKFYSHILTKHPLGEKARKYLLGRGIGASLREKYRLGYAPGGWENLLGFLVKRKQDLSDVVASGLVVGRSSGSKQGFYDRFRDRIIFPIADSRGTILGFSGRVLNVEAKEAKYVNTPETPVFNKGSILFGLDVAREAIRERKYVVLVEGEFDAISLYGMGVKNVVASKGTALTDKQVATIARICENVALCFDTDLAGDAAARRGIEMLDHAGVNVKVVNLGKYKDPDEFVRKDPSGFKKALKLAVNVYDYLVDSAALRFDLTSPIGKKKFGREILPMLGGIGDEIVRAYYMTKVSGLLNLDVGLISTAVERGAPEVDVTSESGEVKSGGLLAERYFLALFFSNKKVERQLATLVDVGDFSDSQSKELWRQVRAIIGSSPSGKAKSLDLATVLARVEVKLAPFIDELFLINISPAFADLEVWAAELIKVAARIREAALRRKLAEISKELSVAEKENQFKKIEMLSKSFKEISEKMKEAVKTNA